MVCRETTIINDILKNSRRSREGGSPGTEAVVLQTANWIPACAGMTFRLKLRNTQGRHSFMRSIIKMGIAGLAISSSPALAQKYPVKPIRMIVPYTPGGPTDILARAVGQSMTEAWGQPVIIENRPGASGNLGTAAAAKSPPDGYTLGVVGISFSVAPALEAKLGYDPVKDLTPVALLASVNNLLVVHPSLPAKSVKELIAFAKARPGEVSFASGGPGGAQHLAGELFNSMAGIKMTHIPYKGSAPGLTALIGGEVTVGFTDMLITLPHVKSGKLRALAVTGATRSGLIPELPTVSEAGLKDYAVTAWFGMLAPAGTPADIVAQLNAEVVKSLKTAQMKERLAALGADAAAGSTADFAAFLKSEMAKWAKVVKAAGIRGE
jgi:tripartite-type tricarboxylate transporter receptor subunit TctC